MSLNHIIQTGQHRRKRYHYTDRAVPSEGPLPAARVSKALEKYVVFQNSNVTAGQSSVNKKECVRSKSYNSVSLQKGELAQIKLLSASSEVCRSPEEFVVTYTPTIAGGQFVVQRGNRNCPYPCVLE